MSKSIELSLSYFGKRITVKNYSSVLHAQELYNMFKGIMISEFGEQVWENLTKVQNEKEMDFYELIDTFLPKVLER